MGRKTWLAGLVLGMLIGAAGAAWALALTAPPAAPAALQPGRTTVTPALAGD